MAGENLSSINSALSQIFAPDLSRQWNRTAIFAGLLAAKGDVGDGKGKNVAFDVEFSGNTATTVAEGADVSAGEYASDINLPAVLPWAHYRSSFQITETELDAASSSVGIPQALQDLFGDRVLGAGAKLARQIDADMLTGTGVDGSGNPTIVGIFGGALAATGTYAGISTTTYTEWASNIVGNSGVARPLTTDLLAQVDQNIFTASGLPWTNVITSAGVLRKYEGLFIPNQRINDGQRGMPVGTGAPNDAQMQPDAWYKGKSVLRDAVNPTGKIAFINSDFIKVKYLPRVMTPQDAVFAKMMGLSGSSGGNAPIQATQIPARIAIMAKTGDSIKVSVKVTLQMCVTRPNAMGICQDVSEV